MALYHRGGRSVRRTSSGRCTLRVCGLVVLLVAGFGLVSPAVPAGPTLGTPHPAVHAGAPPGTYVARDLGSLGVVYGGDAYARAINNSGQIAGVASSIFGRSSAVLWSADGALRELGALGGNSIEVVGINESGHVAGHGATATGERHAFLWTPTSGMRDLGSSGTQSFATAINGSDHVVGYFWNATGQQRAFRWTPSGGMQDLGTLGGTSSNASAINENGYIVGSSTTASGQEHAFLWTPMGGVQDLGTLGGTFSVASAVNGSGYIVGASSTSAGPVHAFLWTPSGSGMEDLGTLGGTSSFASAINENGYVVGDSRGPSFQMHAVLWTPTGGIQDLGTLSGNSSKALTLNGSGQVVGIGTTASGEQHAFLWTLSGGIQDLDTPGGSLSFPQAINDGGQVIGYRETASGEVHAFLWTAMDGMRDLELLGATQSAAQAMNASGQVVGTSYTTSGQVHAFLWTATMGMEDLGTLGGARSLARAINESGHVAGHSYTASGQEHAFLWTAATGMQDLGTLGGAHSFAHAINESGQVVGYSYTASGQQHAFLWSSTLQDLGTLGGVSSSAEDINDSGHVVGWAHTASGQQHAFLWTPSGAMQDLGTLGGPQSFAQAINENGQILGFFRTTSGQQHAFLWTEATGMRDLGTLGGAWSTALAMNENGQVVGYSSTASGQQHAFLWTAATGMRDLGTLGGASSLAQGINGSGQVVGWSQTASGAQHAFLHDPGSGSMVDLGTLGGMTSIALRINDGGQIAGHAHTALGETHAVLWDPNRAPVADAGPDREVECMGPGTPVTLDASASSDLDGDTLTFTWTVDGMTGTGTTAVFLLAVGRHDVTLQVDDGRGGVSTDDLTVTIVDTQPPTADTDGDGVPDWSDNAPFDANPDQLDQDGDGIGDVSDPNPLMVDLARFVVEQTSGNGAEFTLPMPDWTDNCRPVVQVTSDAPAVFPLGGPYVVTITAIDGTGNSTQVRWTVAVVDRTPPTLIIPAADQTYSDPTAFAAAARIRNTLDFQSDDGFYGFTGYSAAGVRFTDSQSYLFVGTGALHWGLTAVSGQYGTLEATLPPATTAVSALIRQFHNEPGVVVRITLSTGRTIDVTGFGLLPWTFVGITSSTPLQWIRFQQLSGRAPMSMDSFSIGGNLWESDRAAYESTVRVRRTVDFEAGDDGQPLGDPGRDVFYGFTGLSVGGVTFTESLRYIFVRDTGDAFLYAGYNPSPGVYGALDVALPRGVTGVGVLMRPFYFDPSVAVRITLSTGQVFEVADFQVFAWRFFGAISSAPIEWIRIQQISGPGPLVLDDFLIGYGPNTFELGSPVTLPAVQVSDNCDAAPSVTNDAPVSFPLGTTIVTFTATDGSGNTATATAEILVVDTRAPVFLGAPPPDLDLDGDGIANGVDPDVDGDGVVNAADNCPYVPNPDQRDSDGDGHADACDTAPFVANADQSRVTVEQTSPAGASVVLRAPLAFDPVTGAVQVTGTVPTLFPPDTTIVTFTATDPAGNSATFNVTVEVVDTTAPVFTNVPLPVVVEQHGSAPAMVTLIPPTATDAADPNPVVTSDPLPPFVLGTTTVTFTATDRSGNQSTATTTVTVRDLCVGPLVRLVTAHPASGGSVPGLHGHGGARGVSADGRYVLFSSTSNQFAAGDTNNAPDIFVRDLQTGTMILVSSTPAGTPGNNSSFEAAITPDGRYVVFRSIASDLVAGDSVNTSDIFLRDLSAGTTTLISRSSSGVQGNGFSAEPSISDDGRFIAFHSQASTFFAGDDNGTSDVFLHDRLDGSLTLVSRSVAGGVGNNFSVIGLVSNDGSRVAFISDANNLVPGDTNKLRDVFVFHRQTGAVELASVNASGSASGNSASEQVSISADGLKIAFRSFATDLVPGDANGWPDVFVRDLSTGVTSRASLNAAGTDGGNGHSLDPVLSRDGRRVAFLSYATDLVPGDINGVVDVYVRDLAASTTVLVNRDPSTGKSGNGASDWPALSGDGSLIVFRSAASDLVPGDGNNAGDVFLFDLGSGAITLVSRRESGDGSANAQSYFPVVSRDGRWIVFNSLASDLMPADLNKESDIFAFGWSDWTPPTITAPPDSTFPKGVDVILGMPVVSDVCDAGPTVGNDAPIAFPLGVTIVTWTATDLAGNSATATQRITIVQSTVGGNVDIGSGVTIGDGVSFRDGASVGDGVTIEDGVTIGTNAQIGDGTTLGIDTTVRADAVVGQDVTLGSDVIIGSGATIEDGAVIEDGAIVRAGATIGRNVRIGANAVIAADAVLGDDVCIGQLATVRSGAQVGHGARIGQEAIVGQNAQIGDQCDVGDRSTVRADARVGAAPFMPPVIGPSRLGADVTVKAGIVVGEGVSIGDGETITGTVSDGQTIGGTPTQPTCP